MSQAQLPIEICDSIIDILHDDKPSLMQCSLVCRRFVYHSQRLLFRRIVLHCPLKISKNNIVTLFYPAEAFFLTITRSPHLCKLVMTLEISNKRDECYSEANRTYDVDKSLWMYTDCTIFKILPLLCALEELIITGHCSYRPAFNFTSLKEELQSAVLSKSQFLRRLSLSKMNNVPLALLNNIPILESLHLNHVKFSSDGPFPSIDSPYQTKLKDFQICSSCDTWSSLYPWLQSKNCSIDVTHLTELRLAVLPSGYIPNGSVDSMSWILRGCANTLKHLQLCYPNEGKYESPYAVI